MNSSIQSATTQVQTDAPPCDGVMTFSDHLLELRHRLIISLVTVVAATAVAFFFSRQLIHYLQILVPTHTEFVQLSPGEVFLSSFRLSVFVGLGVALPVVLYQFFRFVTPGLKAREKQLLIPTLVLSFALFVLGVTFGYRFILPLMLVFLLDYGNEVAKNQLSIASFLNFCTGFLFASGIIFQLPIFLLLTSFIGLVNSQKLIKMWKWAVVTSFILAAVITPSADPFSQLVMALSLMVLYGFSIMLVKLFRR